MNWPIDIFDGTLSHSSLKEIEYGIPEEKKFPLDTRAHVISAVKFFNYAAPKYRRALANRIIRKVREYGIKLTESKDNDFYKYVASNSDYISHYGVLGQKWGIKNGPPYPLYIKHLGAKKN